MTGEPRPAADEGAADALAARLARSLGDGAVGAAVDGVALVLVPDPDAPGARRRLTAALGERTGVVGPAVGWRRTWLSVGRAFAVHGLQAAGRVPADGLVAVEDHLSALLLAADPGLAGELCRAPAGAARARARGVARPTGRDAARVARPPRPGAGRGGGARRAPADRALPRGRLRDSSASASRTPRAASSSRSRCARATTAARPTRMGAMRVLP